MKKKILLITLTLSLILTGCNSKEKEHTQVLKTDGILSYTIDGESTNEQPTKESGYIVNKIVCDSDIDLMWDNDNWEVEFTNITSGKCTIDFTKDTSTQGYRITVTSNNPSSLDSLSKATVENGTVKIYSKSTLKSVTGCNGIVEDNNVIVSNITENQTCNIIVELKTLADTLKQAYTPQAGRTDFTTIDNGTPALYTGTDDQGTTYYFSGDGSQMNNWVSFAGKLWRIIRINGNGSVRMLYAGNGNDAADIGSSVVFNSSYDHPGYVGWKYSLGNSLDAIRGNAYKSNAYTTVENWYNALSSTDKNYIDENAIYCNDRNIGSGSFSTSSKFYYAAYTRFVANKQAPKFTCNASDQFKDGFGLMTVDEVTAAGGLYNTNSPKAYYYLAKDNNSSIVGGKWWWTMTPSMFLVNDDGSCNGRIIRVFGTASPGNMGDTLPNNTANGVVRPVVSLKPEVIVTNGNGSANNPYIVSLPN